MLSRRHGSHFISLMLIAALIVPNIVRANEDDSFHALVPAYNSVGLELFDTLAKLQGNLVISPHSIGTALTMARMGARGETESEMVKVFGDAGDHSEVALAVGRLQTQLESTAKQSGHRLRNANALHLTTYGELVSRTYRNLLAEQFGAEVFAGSDVGAINAWVRDKTDGKLERILDRLDPFSVCVLLNAVTFKADWAHPFDPRQTKPGDFRLRRDSIVEVSMMRRAGSFKILRAHSFDAIALPYKGGDLLMIIILPMPVSGTFPIPQGLSPETFRAIMRGLPETEAERVRLHFPRFTLKFGADLIPSFKELGMRRAFDRDRADFSGIIESARGEDRIHITQIQHNAVLEVNEAGTEAAASTAVEMGLRSSGPPPSEYRIDRPFLFFVADRKSESILFMGRVSEPGAFQD